MLHGLRIATVIMIAVLVGCSRTHYRTRADADAYSILLEKSAGTPWMPPSSYSVQPHPLSRFYDPTPPDDPLLPLPAPQLYAYDLPPLPQRDPNRFRPSQPQSSGAAAHGLAMLRLPPIVRPGDLSFTRLPPTGASSQNMVIQAAAYAEQQEEQVAHADMRWLEQPEPRALERSDTASEDLTEEPTQAPEEDLELPMPRPGVPGPPEDAELPTPPADLPGAEAAPAPRDLAAEEAAAEEGAVVVTPIPPSSWDDIPRSCRERMFEFESLREEYGLTYDEPVPPEQRSDAPRLTLEDIVDLARINSREYQRQKEILYSVALRLSLERFDYDLKFSPNGHRTTVDYLHDRTLGRTVNTLNVPTSFQAEKMLVTGGDFLARFANSVILTFNGPQGFSSDISSELLFDISQTVFQRDVRFERLTQAERDVVYAARDFARFRKTLFTDLAEQYYGLIRTFRQIEIDSQNYFTLVRAFRQAQAEQRAGFQSRIQVDQVEQQVLRALRTLIQRCNGLERSLDSLKLTMGLPTETPMGMDLTELELLTVRDQLAVTGDLIDRVRNRLQLELAEEFPDRVALLNSVVVLIERILDSYELREDLGETPPESDELRDLAARLRVQIVRISAEEVREELQDELDSESPDLTIIFQRTIDLLDTLLDLIDRQLALARRIRPDAAEIPEFQQRREELQEQTDETREELARLVAEASLDELPALVDRAAELRETVEQLVEELDAFVGEPAAPPPAEQQLEETLAISRRMLERSAEVLRDPGGGLVPVEIGYDEAMMTALVLRFDLINERGFLADDWRQIKLAADDLRSVLNLNATQTIRTPQDNNRPFAFTFDESRTQLRATFDLPLNRRAQRNTFRQELINYQAALRRLMQLEDNVKFSVRNDLRSLALDQEQYVIDVASAALAFERVLSTTLEFRLGQTSARNFLESQQDYTQALSSVAFQHIGYIVDRMQLFLDLELLTVGEDGFWEELYEEQHQPEPYHQLPPYATPAYGRLPHVWYSHEIQRMRDIPPGNAMIHRAPEEAQQPELLPSADPHYGGESEE